MQWDALFFCNNVLLGVGLAMDAVSVSLANGLAQPNMSRKKMCGIAGVFGAFQALMPLLGWVCVHTLVRYFGAVQKVVPWIALVLLAFIGGKMLIEGIRGGEEQASALTLSALLVQGIATSIDALSVGFTIAEYSVAAALVSAAIIALVTFVLCMAALAVGKRFGTKLAGKAQIIGGVILIAVGLEIWLKSLLG